MIHTDLHANCLFLTLAAPAEAPVAPMHGRVMQMQVPVAAGQAVRAGELLVVLEATKVGHRVVALHDGTVAAVHARVGEQVAARKLLVEVARS